MSRVAGYLVVLYRYKRFIYMKKMRGGKNHRRGKSEEDIGLVIVNLGLGTADLV
jgi:hypothetical protein